MMAAMTVDKPPKIQSQAARTSLEDLQDRILSSDLIPSHEPLRDGLAAKLAAIQAAGVQNAAELLVTLKSARSSAALATSTGIDLTYLQLLRRAVNGFFPKPRPLKDIDWLGDDAVASLATVGIKNTAQLFEAASDPVALTQQTGLQHKTLDEMVAIADLCRIQWVSPGFARVLVAVGLRTASEVARADPDALCAAIAATNAEAKFYKGKVGLRDVKRLVKAAAYVP